jgi:signal transduction histidine kinase
MRDARTQVDQLEAAAREAYADVRENILALRTTLAPDRDLLAALREYGIGYQRQTGITVNLSAPDGDVEAWIEPAAQIQLLRVAQEALTNVRKHAHTTRARLALRRQRSGICLEVQDWGDGFHPLSLPNRVNPGERVGLRGMQDRIALLGGHFAIRSQPGAGTLVRAEIPVLGLDEEVFHAT